MGRQIKLNINDLKSLIGEAVNHVLNEGYGRNVNYRELSDDFMIMAHNLQTMSEQLNAFIQEYPKFIQTMESKAQEFGLVMTNASTDEYFDIDDLNREKNFEFEYSIPNVDINSMSDEEYESFEEQLNNMRDDMEFALKSFKIGTSEVRTHNIGLDIYYSFSFWQ